MLHEIHLVLITCPADGEDVMISITFLLQDLVLLHMHTIWFVSFQLTCSFLRRPKPDGQNGVPSGSQGKAVRHLGVDSHRNRLATNSLIIISVRRNVQIQPVQQLGTIRCIT